MRVVVTGGRDFHHYETVHRALRKVLDKHGPFTLIHGGARGADTMAETWAMRNHIERVCFKADWEKHGKKAGVLRNQQMIDEGNPDACIAFPGGRGTADMVNRCTKAGLPVWLINSPRPAKTPVEPPK